MGNQKPYCRGRTDNTKDKTQIKKQREKQRSTKHYTENQRHLSILTNVVFLIMLFTCRIHSFVFVFNLKYCD
jgi:hypothetical protein